MRSTFGRLGVVVTAHEVYCKCPACILQVYCMRPALCYLGFGRCPCFGIGRVITYQGSSTPPPPCVLLWFVDVGCELLLLLLLLL